MRRRIALFLNDSLSPLQVGETLRKILQARSSLNASLMIPSTRSLIMKKAPMKISAASQFKRNQDVVAQWTEDTLVLLTLQAGNYYSLNLTGGKAWDYCDGERNAGEIIDLICEEYETERSVAQEDLLALFEELCEERLLTVL